MLNNLSNAVKATNLRASIQAFEQSKAPIWGKFGMSNHQKGHSDVGVSLSQCSPEKILYHAVILVLSGAVISMEEHILFTHPMMLEKVMKLTHNCVRTLPTIPRLITEEIDLPGDCLTVDTEYCTLSRSEEVDRSRLKGVTRIMHLLCIIEAVVNFNRERVGRGVGC